MVATLKLYSSLSYPSEQIHGVFEWHVIIVSIFGDDDDDDDDARSHS